MRRSASLLAALATLASLGAPVRPALAADPLVYSAADPGLCDDGWQLGRIRHRFSYQVRHVPDLPDVRISEFYNIQAARYEGEDEKHPIFRQYCRADALLSDGRTHRVWYLIEGDQGFASLGTNVEFCVDGFDRWHVYNGGCRVLR